MSDLYLVVFYGNSHILIPTAVSTTAGVIMYIEPMVLVSVDSIENMREAILRTVKKGNRIVPHPNQQELSELPSFYEKLGFKSHKAFKHQSIAYEISRINDIYSIEEWRVGIFHNISNEHKIIKFPSSTSVESVVDKLIEIIQQTHHQKMTTKTE